MLIENSPVVRMAMAVVIYPVTAIVLYGSARLIAMALVRVLPDSKLKRKLFTDTDTGLLAYKPGVRRKRSLKGGTLSRRDS
jgi:hypothetical protein